MDTEALAIGAVLFALGLVAWASRALGGGAGAVMCALAALVLVDELRRGGRFVSAGRRRR